MKPLIAGNWKMHGLAASAVEFDRMIEGYAPDLRAEVDLMICPPATLLSKLADWAGSSGIMIGGQDCHFEASGAYTGCVSAEMIRDAGGDAVILGHSERRQYFHETDELIAAKALAALRAGLTAILCVGETATERKNSSALQVVEGQIHGALRGDLDPAKLVIAYEPVWAIGSGMSATVEDVAEMHGYIRMLMRRFYGPEADGVRILYGGSVKPANARELLALPDVGGALVGGASLKAADFLAIAHAAVKQTA